MAHIEHHPENGHVPWVVVLQPESGGRLWFAYQTKAEAEERLPDLDYCFSRMQWTKEQLRSPNFGV